MHGIRDDAPGYFGDEPPKTMTLVTSEIIRVYGTEAVSVVGDLSLLRKSRRWIHRTRTTNEIRANWKQIDILACCVGGNIGAKGPGRKTAS